MYRLWKMLCEWDVRMRYLFHIMRSMSVSYNKYYIKTKTHNNLFLFNINTKSLIWDENKNNRNFS